ncbi:MAG: hypothetical protein ABIG66_00415 [Candidatus Kerfeldbacteria bacterium]
MSSSSNGEHDFNMGPLAMIDAENIPVLYATGKVENCPSCGRVLVWNDCKTQQVRDQNDSTRIITVHVCSYPRCSKPFKVMKAELLPNEPAKPRPPYPSDRQSETNPEGLGPGGRASDKSALRPVPKKPRFWLFVKVLGFFAWLMKKISPRAEINTAGMRVAYGPTKENGYYCPNNDCGATMKASEGFTGVDVKTRKTVRARRCGQCGLFYLEPKR